MARRRYVGTRWAVAEKRFGRIRYLCSPRALPYVERAQARALAKTQASASPDGAEVKAAMGAVQYAVRDPLPAAIAGS